LLGAVRPSVVGPRSRPLRGTRPCSSARAVPVAPLCSRRDVSRAARIATVEPAHGRARYRSPRATHPVAQRLRPEVGGGAVGKLDVLVNNAGILKLGMIESQSLDDYMSVVNVNQVGCWLGMQAAIPALKANGGGVIINTSSTSGLVGTVGLSAYTASKFAVRG